MRAQLDESLPNEAADVLRTPGWERDTVHDEGLRGPCPHLRRYVATKNACCSRSISTSPSLARNPLPRPCCSGASCAFEYQGSEAHPAQLADRPPRHPRHPRHPRLPQAPQAPKAPKAPKAQITSPHPPDTAAPEPRPRPVGQPTAAANGIRSDPAIAELQKGRAGESILT